MTEVSGDAIRELRSSFLKKLEAENKTEGFFAEVDVAQVKADDEWLGRFLLHHEMVQDDALSKLWETLERRKQNRVTSLINITPADAVIFKYDATNSEYVGQIHISNISNDKNVSFKIKTTTQEKFCVHPSTGILGVEGMEAITVTLLPDFTPNQIMKEKFLIMCLPVESIDLDSIALSALWKAANTTNTENYRLGCAVECCETDQYVGSTNSGTKSTYSRFRMNGTAPVGVNEKIVKKFKRVCDNPLCEKSIAELSRIASVNGDRASLLELQVKELELRLQEVELLNTRLNDELRAARLDRLQGERVTVAEASTQTSPSEVAGTTRREGAYLILAREFGENGEVPSQEKARSLLREHGLSKISSKEINAALQKLEARKLRR